MSGQRSSFGVSLYYRLDEKKVLDFLYRSLIDSAGRIAGVQVVRFATTTVGEDSYSRFRKITTKSLEDLLARAARREIDIVTAEDRGEDRLDDVPFAYDLNLVPGRGGFQILNITGPAELYREAELMEYLRLLCQDFPTCFGCITASSVFNKMLSELTFTPINPPCTWERPLDEDHARYNSELCFYQEHISDICNRIPKAYWGTVLSPSHIAGLGGDEQICNERRCFLVERWGENFYLQLTESPWDVSREELVRLNEYFRPIRFPDAPEAFYW